MKKLNIFTLALLILSMLSLSATEIITKDVTDSQGHHNTIWRPLASRVLFNLDTTGEVEVMTVTVAIAVDGYKDLAEFQAGVSGRRQIVTVTLEDGDAVNLTWTLSQLINNDASFLKGGVISDE